MSTKIGKIYVEYLKDIFDITSKIYYYTELRQMLDFVMLLLSKTISFGRHTRKKNMCLFT